MAPDLSITKHLWVNQKRIWVRIPQRAGLLQCLLFPNSLKHLARPGHEFTEFKCNAMVLKRIT